MNSRIRLSGLTIVVLMLVLSCTKDKDAESMATGYSIRSISSDGKVITKFEYTVSGKIAESQSMYSYDKFTYDSSDHLVKREIAIDPGIFSSSMFVAKTELMTAENSTFDSYSVYEYNEAGLLVGQKNYTKKTGEFTLASMVGFEYEGGKLVKRILKNAENIATQFDTYQYDTNGNVAKEKYYSYLFQTGTEAKLMSETSFKYDDKNNPFAIYCELGQPGLYSNKNNITESNSTSYADAPGVSKYSTTKTSYEYNKKGFPTKVNDREEYTYD
jgi:hypothetical protein